MTTVFWTVLAFMALLSVAFVLPPMLRKKELPRTDRAQANVAVFRQKLTELEAELAAGAIDEHQFESGKADYERQLLADAEQAPLEPLTPGNKLTALAIACAAPMLSLWLYAILGAPNALHEANAAAQTRGSGAPSANPNLPPLTEMVTRLEQRLKAEPGNSEGWMMLGKTYAVLGRLADALAAYQRGLDLAPKSPDLLIGKAEIAARMNNNRFDPQSDLLLSQALLEDPNNRSGLWLAGVSAFQKGDGAAAVKHWERLTSAHVLEGEELESLKGYLAEARSMESPSSPKADPQPSAAVPTAPDSAGGASITVKVSLAAAFHSQVEGREKVFIFARAAQGPKMPLAIATRTVEQLPLSVTLDDSMAMMPATRLSRFTEIVVGARISKTGDAIAAAGDLQGMSPPATFVTGQTFDLEIDSIVR